MRTARYFWASPRYFLAFARWFWAPARYFPVGRIRLDVDCHVRPGQVVGFRAGCASECGRVGHTVEKYLGDAQKYLGNAQKYLGDARKDLATVVERRPQHPH